ncbi:MAG: hypothetical protein RLP14_02170 [Owenweeksia sp.]
MSWRIIVLILFACGGSVLNHQAQAQTWAPVGGGIPEPVRRVSGTMHTTSANGKIYVAYCNTIGPVIPFLLRETKVMVWNGLSWSTLPVPPTTDWAHGIAVMNGNIYLLSWGFQREVMVFDGNSWNTIFSIDTSPQSNDAGSMSHIEVVDGELFILGKFHVDIGGTIYRDVVSYDGSALKQWPVSPPDMKDVADIQKINNDLFIIGQPSDSSSHPIGLAKLNGNQWDMVVNHVNGAVNAVIDGRTGIFTFQGNTYVHAGVSFPKVYRFSGDTIHFEDILRHPIRDVAEFNNKLYIVGDSIGRNNGASEYISEFDGSKATQIANAPIRLVGVEVLGSDMYVFSQSMMVFNGLNYNQAFKTSSGFSTISGKVFLDPNSNCVLDSGETLLPNIKVGLVNQATSVTNGVGEYSIGVQPGTYSFKTVGPASAIGKNLTLNCSTPLSVTLSAGQGVIQDLGLSHNTPIDGLTIMDCRTGFVANHGFLTTYIAKVGNPGNTAIPSLDVSVEVPPTVTVTNTAQTPVSVNGNTYTFSLSNLQPLETREFKIYAKIDVASNSIGDTLVWTSTLGPLPGDSDLSDNTDTLQQTIVAAVDPNDKQASAYTIGSMTRNLDYMIRFQNTGTAPAHKVVIVDSLDASLQHEDILIESASHPFTFRLDENILIWTFDNIMLPDSGTDYEGSQGYLRFTLGVNDALDAGDTIDNDAEIYFDYQPAVHTNHARTSIVSNISIMDYGLAEQSLQVFPNPTAGRINIKNPSGLKTTLLLCSNTGKVLRKISLMGEIISTQELGNLPGGVYFLKAEGATYRIVLSEN